MMFFFDRTRAGMLGVFLDFASQPPGFVNLLVWACGVPSSFPHPGSLMQEDGKDVADGGFGSGRERIVKGVGESTPENSHRLSQFPHSPPDGAWWCLEPPGRRNGGLQAAAVGKCMGIGNVPWTFHNPFLA